MQKKIIWFGTLFALVLLLGWGNPAYSATVDLEQVYIQAESYYKNNQPYDALQLFSQGYNSQPQDIRFKDGVLKSQRLILSWSFGSHNKGTFSAAINGYSEVLNSPTVLSYYKNIANRNKILAENRKPVYSQQNYISDANSLYNNSKPYEALELFSEGYSYFADKQLYDGLIKSGQTILSWSKGSHSRGTFGAAINGYNIIINNPYLSKDLKETAQQLLPLAMEQKKLLSKVQYIDKISKITDPYEKLIVSQEAYSLFPGGQEFIEGISESRNTIFLWSKGSHSRGNFNAAINGYDTILSSKLLSQSFKEEVQKYKYYAQQQIKILLSKTAYINKITKISDPYEKLILSQEAYSLYPDEQKFIQGINDSRNTILLWSKGSHRRGTFGAAINGYNTILGSVLLNQSLKEEVQRYKYFAQQAKILYKPEELLNKAESIRRSNPYGALNIFKDGLYLYPSYQQQFKLGILLSSETILSWSKGSHSKGSFTAAIAGYQTVIDNSQNITSQMLADATINLELAKKGIIYNPEGRYFVNTVYNISLAALAQKQASIVDGQPVRSGVGEEPYWVKATTQEIQQALDPQAILKNNPYQFLILSGISGISTEELNIILEGQGTLHNTGQAFKDAALINKINEVYLVNHAFLETGRGTSPLAKGVIVNGKKVYNFFGIGAYDEDPVGLGAKFAYDQGWDTIEKAIVGGAGFIAKRYINNASYGQDTLYKMRWNPENPATHQYATDIGWAEKQSNMIKSIYDKIKGAVLRFDIPVFNG